MVDVLLNGGIYRYYFYDNNTIESEYFNVNYTLYCSTWNITGNSGNRSLTRTEHSQLIKYFYNNSGVIKIIGSSYGDGILISKKTGSKYNYETMELMFITCDYTSDAGGSSWSYEIFILS